MRPNPLGFDLRAKRACDRFAAELFNLYTKKPRQYKALARQHARKYLEIDSRIPEKRRQSVEEGTRPAAGVRARGVGTWLR